jgi:hypothetical protein
MREECPKCGSINWKLDKRFSDSWVEGRNIANAICECGHVWKISVWKGKKKITSEELFSNPFISNLINYKREMDKKDQEIAILRSHLERIRTYVPQDESCCSIPMMNIVYVLREALGESDEEGKNNG